MAKKLTRIERDIAEHPARYDYGDVPRDHYIIPAQEAAYDALRPRWANDLADGK